MFHVHLTGYTYIEIKLMRSNCKLQSEHGRTNGRGQEHFKICWSENLQKGHLVEDPILCEDNIKMDLK
jgi:hypothetical protein